MSCSSERVTITTGQRSLRATIDLPQLTHHPSFPWDFGTTLCGKKIKVDHHMNKERHPQKHLTSDSK